MKSLLNLVGNTPVVHVDCDLPTPQPGFLAKLEAVSVGGMKARAALSMLQGARARGELAPGAPVVESTSGTLGIGLAFAACSLGHPLTLVVDADLEPPMRALLTAYGARLEIVPLPHVTGGWQDARLRRVRAVLDRDPRCYWPDQYNNPDNIRGYTSLADELVKQVPGVDVLVCSVGTGGHSAGIVGALRRRWPGVRLVGVDSVGSTIFGQPARARLMRGLGSSIHPATWPIRSSTRCTGSGRSRPSAPARNWQARPSSLAAGAREVLRLSRPGWRASKPGRGC